jgi:Glutaminase
MKTSVKTSARAAAARETAIVTVAAVRKHDRQVQYLFNERQRIYTMTSAKRALSPATNLLNIAARENAPVKVSLDAYRGVIERVEKPPPEALREFESRRVPLEEASQPLRLEADKIDPTVFNIVDYHLKWPCFSLCTKIIPNYLKAKEIFDFCAKQSCNLPGPFDISPCIPFQYVIDGCYARAHKMRWIITTKYNYCCEKVFSFANQNQDTLAVKADKWGGCCVTWWYHVAPLVRVHFGIPAFGKLTVPISLTLAMVIDPGMFDKPVLLSTWLSAQANKNCSANAKVSMYSIQPGSAYWPANYQGTQFGTDNNYVQTDQTLTNYHSLVTCP